MKSVKAFAPANISCIFRLYGNNKPEEKGSLGVGFTLDKGVTVCVRKSNKTKIKVNGKERRFRTVRSIIKKLTNLPVEVNIKNDVPFGAGFGLSGASALATAYALNKLLNLGKVNKELAMIAHVSEVENSTGRGDVGGQFNGGFMIKTEKAKPLEVINLRIREKDVYYKVYGKIETKRVIDNKEKTAKINKAGDKALRKIGNIKSINFGKIIEISKEFAKDSGLLKSKRVINAIRDIEKKGGKASMIMLGEAVFSNITFKGCEKAGISSKGACLSNCQKDIKI